MINGFIAKKSTMGKIFLDDGRQITITRCLASPLLVTQLKNAKQDGYVAVQVAYGTRKSLKKPVADRLKKLKLDKSPKGFIEFAPIAEADIAVGQDISIDTVFKIGDTVDVSGTSKGHGFAGVIKRHGFHRQPVSGGQSDRVRAPGAIGAQTPGKVVRGKKMPGHFGGVTSTVTHLKIVGITSDKNELLIAGSIPGSINSWVVIKKA